jgi:hypothetical protein
MLLLVLGRFWSLAAAAQAGRVFSLQGFSAVSHGLVNIVIHRWVIITFPLLLCH